jgi:hypothetical protein
MSLMLGEIVVNRLSRSLSSSGAADGDEVSGDENSGCVRSVRRQSTSIRWRSCGKPFSKKRSTYNRDTYLEDV